MKSNQTSCADFVDTLEGHFLKFLPHVFDHVGQGAQDEGVHGEDGFQLTS